LRRTLVLHQVYAAKYRSYPIVQQCSERTSELIFHWKIRRQQAMIVVTQSAPLKKFN
jgi:hypothetical protein